MRNLIFMTIVAALSISPISHAADDPASPPANVYQEVEGRFRARNLARQAAERANGGLEKYRAESTMHSQEAAPNSDNPNYWVFVVRGGAPGSSTPTIETEVQVNKSNYQTTVVYNGSLRTAANPQPSPSATVSSPNNVYRDIEGRFRARNLARQAAERTNGGLEKYRAEPAMYTQEVAPDVDEPTHWVFIFQGGAPGAATPTVETEVRVDKADFKTTVLYNGSLRGEKIQRAQSAAAQIDPKLSATFQEVNGRNRARNLARQAAERANGGLEKYRANSAVHTKETPVKDNGDHWVFILLGGLPGSSTPTIETEVRVDKADFKTSVLYNGAIRTSTLPQ
jgi:hypothetical protein